MHVLVVLVIAWLADGRVSLSNMPYQDQKATLEECQTVMEKAAQQIQLEQGNEFQDVVVVCVERDLVRKKNI
jgi:hypothetical protein